MKNNRKNIESLNEAKLLQAFETCDFNKLKQFQIINKKTLKINFFKKQITLIIEKNIKKIEKESLKKKILNKIKNFENSIISISEIKIKKRFSSGGSSTVYKGKYKFIDVAIKKISLKIINKKNLELIFNEIDILSKLNHKNIVFFFGVIIDEDFNLFIITEFYEKGNLRNFLKNNNNKINYETKIEILFDIARALDYLHSKSPPILHRDIKPENIFITKNNKGKLGDFGISKILVDTENIVKDKKINNSFEELEKKNIENSDKKINKENIKKEEDKKIFKEDAPKKEKSKEESKKKTKKQKNSENPKKNYKKLYEQHPTKNYYTQTCSTLEYMSPETLSECVYYKESDIYSFGVLAYELFSGKDYTNKGGFAFIKNIVRDRVRPSLEGFCFKGIVGIVEMCWDDDWRKRPSSERICFLLDDLR